MAKSIIKMFSASANFSALLLLFSLSSCSSNSADTENAKQKDEAEIVEETSSTIWSKIQYIDEFNDHLECYFLQAQLPALYTDPNFDKLEIYAYLSIDPVISHKCIFSFSDGTKLLKNIEEMSLSVKDGDGVIHNTTIYLNEDGHGSNILDDDIVYELLKTGKPLSFHALKTYDNGKISITFSYPGDKQYNKLVNELDKTNPGSNIN